jgi:hypothetical protein
MKKTILRAAIFVLTCYLLFIIGLVTMQQHLLYVPITATPNITKAPENTQAITVKTSDDLSLTGWYIPPSTPDVPSIIMFHGNAGSIETRPNKMRAFINQGYGVLLAEYRGFGGNLGEPSEQGLYNDARAYMDWALTHMSPPYFIYGESMGTAVSVKMASEYDVNGVILDSPFSAILDIAKQRYFYVPFMEHLLRDHFNSAAIIKHVEEPVLIGMGKMDLVVPYALGEKLYLAANDPKSFASYNTGVHFNLLDIGFAQESIDFITTHSLPAE